MSDDTATQTSSSTSTSIPSPSTSSLDPIHRHRTPSGYDSCQRCQHVATSTEYQNGSSTDAGNDSDIPHIPFDAPSWVFELKQSGCRYMDRTSLYDMTGHLLFDSLLSLQGIKHFYYFMEDDEHVTRTIEAFSRKSKTPEEQEQQQILQMNHVKNGNGKGPEAKVAFNLGTKVCGHRGIVHGGLTATLIDEVSGASAFSSIGPCFTANLNVDYKKPLKAECWILLRSYVTRIEGRKAWIETIVEDGDGIIYAKGTALFVRPRNSIDDHMKKQSTESS